MVQVYNPVCYINRGPADSVDHPIFPFPTHIFLYYALCNEGAFHSICLEPKKIFHFCHCSMQNQINFFFLKKN
nr:hypothetical protein Itr_chr03CG16790 [Ipomoea trifida]GMC74560.1 hypothetical protein Iba_chr03cCG11350 [Ipomoea batatas]